MTVKEEVIMREGRQGGEKRTFEPKHEDNKS